MRVTKFTLPCGEEVQLYLDMSGILIGVKNIRGLKEHLETALEHDYVAPQPLEVDSNLKRDIRLFSPSIPCWFEGCEKLRADYLKEVQESDCELGCQKGPIMRKYLHLAAEIQSKLDGLRGLPESNSSS